MMGLTAATAFLFALLLAIRWPLEYAPSFLVRLYFSGLVYLSGSVICYAGFLLTLYLMRSRATWQTAMSLVPMTLILSAPCSAVTYTVYQLSEPEGIPIETLPGLYLLSVVVLIGYSAFVFYVLHLRASRRLLDGDQTVRSYPASTAAHSGALAAEATIAPSEYGHDHASSGSAPLSAKMGAGRADTQGVATDETRVAVDAGNAGQNRLERQVPFLRRLPGNVSRDIVYLKASGHYVEVIASTGSAIISMRLADAVAELGDRGMRIHRSYWANYGHMTGLSRQGRRTLLCLTDGHQLPISRSCLHAARKAAMTLDTTPSSIDPE